MKKCLLPVMLFLGPVIAMSGCRPTNGSGAASSTGSVTTTTAPSSSGGSSAAAAFNKPRKPTGPVLIKVITNGDSPFWDAMGSGLKVGIAAEPGISPQSGWSPPAQTDNNSQKTLFNEDRTNADGIAVSVIDATAFAPVIDAAIDKGLPVITFDSDAPASKRLAYIGTNNYEAGKKAGEEAVKLMPNGGNLVAFVGNMSADNARQRYQGFVDATKDHNIHMLQDPYEDDK
ncbi:MAG TPA: substrate-binding domain-containing protein, partial [Chthonomonadales bacterium]|nr:substrate-binding domain-containing protein [Chthonomonadales bacterium]